MYKYLLFCLFSYCLCDEGLNEELSQLVGRIHYPDLQRASQFAGGEIEKIPTDPKYRDLANEALRQYHRESNKYCPVITVLVHRATEQVVSGLRTKLTFLAYSRKCNSFWNCTADIWERKWLNDKPIKIQCQPYEIL